MDTDTLPLLLTVEQVATLTGLPKRSIYSLAARGTWGPLPDAGRYIRIPRDRVLAWSKGDAVGAVSA